MPAANTRPYEIVAGVVDVYAAPVGTSAPDPGESPGTAWRYLGHTDGGVKVAHSQTIVELRTDQVTAPLKGVRSEEGMNITFSLAEVTPENYALALNRAIEGPDTSNPGYDKITLYRGGFGVETFALLAIGRHLSPRGDFDIVYNVPAVYQSGAPEVDYTKDAKALLAVDLTAIAANAFDPDVADDDIFGTLKVGKA